MVTKQAVAHPRYHASCHPQRPALIMADTGEQITYGELMQNSARAANLFAALGCRQGDTIALLSENVPTYMEICWAAKDSGLYYSCISIHLNSEDAGYIVENCEAKILIASHHMSALAQEIAQRCQPGTRLLMFGGTATGFDNYETLRDEQSATPMHGRMRGASMLYSSGTTGRPKGVRTPLLDVPPTHPPLRHHHLVEQFGFCPDMVFINPGPFYHAAPLRMMMSAQRLGGTAIGFQKFDPSAVLAAIEHYRGTHGFFVPTMFVRMLRLPETERNRYDLSSMRFATHGAAPCPAYLKENMMQWWGPVLYELYGGTEGIGHTFISPQEWLRKKGSVGKAAKGCVIRIVDEEGNNLPPNEPGLIYLGNGREFEYFKDADKTKQARGGEGLATMGDIGYLDEDGYLFLSDRQSHMIISGGVNIYPQEAENILASHPAIDDVAVIGIPNDEFGEEVKAVVVPKTATFEPKILEADILAYCRSRLSAIKCPRSVDFVAQLPRSEAGKLLKRQIKAPYWKGRETLIA